MDPTGPDPWQSLWASIDRFQASLRKSKARQVNSASLRDAARGIVQSYFRSARPQLEAAGLPSARLEALDNQMQLLLQLSNGRSNKAAYFEVFRTLRALRPTIEVERDVAIGRSNLRGTAPQDSPLSGIEEAIINTLDPLVPSAAISYAQALADLADLDRKSLRGTAADLREALREALDYLAPNEDVMKQPGFKLDKDRTRPTMKQKVRFVLRSRGMGDTAIASPEAALERVEESAAVMARSLYDRGSLATHIATTRKEVRQLKLYVDALLAELLEILQ